MEREVYMCICVCICANNMQILGFGGGVGGVRSGGGYHWGGRGGVWGPGDRAHIYIYTHKLYIWVNYNNPQCSPSLKSWLIRNIIPKWP